MRRILIIVSCIICLAGSSVSAKEPSRAQIDALVRSCVRLIQAEDFRGVALMYHYPPDYTEQQLDTDISAVEASLKIFTEEFGAFTEVVPLESPQLYLNIYASSGTHHYWDQHQDIDKIELQTVFEHYGPGYLVIHVANIMVIPEIKAIAFGLPVSGQSAERIREVGNRMLPLMKSLDESRPGSTLSKGSL